MSTAPALNGQLIGQAERVTRALLDRLLDRTGTTFTQWVALNLAATGAGPVERADLAARLAAGLRIEPVGAIATIDDLTAAGLLATGTADRLDVTPAGRARFDQIRAGIAGIGQQLYGDLPAPELATAGRVLAQVIARAEAELADA